MRGLAVLLAVSIAAVVCGLSAQIDTAAAVGTVGLCAVLLRLGTSDVEW